MKPPKCIVHIGMHKTGSSSIQATLAAGMDDPGFVYLTGGRGSNLSTPLYSMLSSHVENFHFHRKHGHDSKDIKAYNRQTRDALTAEIAECGRRIAIISGEGLSRLDPDAVTRLARFLNNRFQSVQIIAYVRPPKSYMESAFQQLLKGGRLRHFEIASLYPNYRDRFEPYIDVFGRESVTFKRFEPKEFPSSCVVTDFCQTIGMKLDATRVRRVNESLSLEAIRLLYTLRVFGGNAGFGSEALRADREMVEFLQEVTGGKLRLASDLSLPVLKDHQKDILWMEEVLGASLSESAIANDNEIHGEEDLLSWRQETVSTVLAKLQSVTRVQVCKDLMPNGKETFGEFALRSGNPSQIND